MKKLLIFIIGMLFISSGFSSTIEKIPKKQGITKEYLQPANITSEVPQFLIILPVDPPVSGITETIIYSFLEPGQSTIEQPPAKLLRGRILYVDR